MHPSRKGGQATLILVAALGLFLIGALGLAIDASHLYAQRQMAQAAADAAAMAAVHSIYARTNTAGYNNTFGAAPFRCPAGSSLTPCYQARLNGFDPAGGDTVSVSFPTAVPGVSLTPSFRPAAVTVTVFRDAQTTLLRFLGPSSSRIAASATAALVEQVAPIPILVLHPDKPGAFDKGGTSDIVVCGGPARSIQVNSHSGSSVLNNGLSGAVDLSRAGPGGGAADPCGGNGADFATFGAPPAFPGTFLPGTDGRYLPHTGPIHDPLKDVPAPPLASAPLSPTAEGGLPVPQGVHGCPAGWPRPCQLFLPGRYPNGIRGPGASGARTNSTACGGSGADCISLFAPGVYYMQSHGFHGGSNSDLRMAACNAPEYPGRPGPLPATPADPDTGCGILVYNTGNRDDDIFEVGANGHANLLGSLPDGKYKGILFFQDRDSGPHNSTAGAGLKPHRLGGGGRMTLTGTIYLTNWETCGAANPGCGIMQPGTQVYQAVDIRGNAGNTTQIIGMIVVGALQLGGGGQIRMMLDPAARLNVIRIALVK